MQDYKKSIQTNKSNKILLLVILLPLFYQAQAFQLNSIKPNLINQTLEKKIGQKIINQLFQANAISLDPINSEYIKELGKKINRKK